MVTINGYFAWLGGNMVAVVVRKHKTLYFNLLDKKFVYNFDIG